MVSHHIFRVFQSRSVGGHATTSQNQGNETHRSVKATAPTFTTKRRDLVWINPSLKQQLQTHIYKNMSATKRSLESNSRKYAVHNNKSRSNNDNRSVVSTESKTSTDNLTTLTATPASASDHPHKTTHHDDEELFVKPTTTHKKFITRNRTELKQLVRRPKYDRSKFKYLAPSHRISDSISLNFNENEGETVDRDQQQQDILSKEDK